MMNIKQHIVTAFHSQQIINKKIVLSWLLLNLLVLMNAVFHEPTVAYDYVHHFIYIETLAELRLPNSDDTEEFFSPPLPYVFPGFLRASDLVDLWWAVKLGQLLNVLLSVGLTFYLLKICDLISPGDRYLKIFSMVFLGILPVYYKTFVFVRGEPLVAFFAVLAVYLILLIFVKEVQKLAYIVALGVILGLMALSRQWGFLLFPAIIFFVAVLAFKDKTKFIPLIKALFISLFISFLVGGWFYLGLLKDYGTTTAFNRNPEQRFSLFNQSAEFYFGLGGEKMFNDPIRDAFPNQLIPIFYSEIWGDYWSYFVVYGKKGGWFVTGKNLKNELSKEPIAESFESNRYQINDYLGRVNLISLFPSALLFGGVLLGLLYLSRFLRYSTVTNQSAAFSLLSLLVMTSMGGYLWFLIMYPNPEKGDTIKATYMIQIFPFVAILTARLLQLIRDKSKSTYLIIMLLVAVVVIHNLPVMTTSFFNCWGGMNFEFFGIKWIKASNNCLF